MNNIDNNRLASKSKDFEGTFKSNENTFWMNDVSILFRDGGYLKFVPTPDMTRVEQLNALTRFFIYMILVLLIIDKTNEYMYLPIFGIIIIIVFYDLFIVNNNGDQKYTNIYKEEMIREPMKNIGSKSDYKTHQIYDDKDIVTINKNNNCDYTNDNDNDSQYVSKGAYSDPYGKIKKHAGRFQNTGQFHNINNVKSSKDIKYMIDDIRMNQNTDIGVNINAKRKHFTVDNPNAYFNEENAPESEPDYYQEPYINVPVACNSDDEDINHTMALKYDEDIYHDIEDVFDKKNSQRQFFSVAHNIPNDMEAFAKWCYKFPPTGKTNQERNLRYYDFRMKYNHGSDPS